MAIFTESLASDIFIIVILLLACITLFFKVKYKHWTNRKVPFVKPQLVFGNFKDNIWGKTSAIDILDRIYKELKDGGHRFGGYWEMHIPKLMILDPSLAYRIIVKDFAHFHDRGMMTVDEEHDPLTNNVASLSGQKWRHLRYKMSPVFTTGKLKGMFDQIYNSGENFVQELEKFADKNEPIDTKDVANIFTNDVITSCAFGLQFPANSPEANTYKEMVRNAFKPSRFILLTTLFKMAYGPLSKALNIRSFSKEVTEYFINLSKETVKLRKQNDIKRNDFLQLLLALKEKEECEKLAEMEQEVELEEDENEEDKMINQLKHSSLYRDEMKDQKLMTDDCLAASSFLFLVAGSEVSTGISFVMYHLASNPEVQMTLQAEVDEVTKRHGGYNYQAIKEMVYLDQVIQESFRMTPISGFLSRVCTEAYKIPDTDVVIDKGTFLVIPVWSIHRDPRHYPDPESFLPERFAGNNFKPSPTFLPFGDGPRICIAMRFAILEMKVCLARLMSRYTISVSDRTIQPLQLDPDYLFMIRVLGGVWIIVNKRTPPT